VEQKGQDHLLRAVSKLSDGHRYRVLFAGDGPLLHETALLAEELGMADRVRFLGQVSDMPGFYEHLDILAVPSRWEGFGRIAVEAMASGVPVIGSDVPGLDEVLRVSEHNAMCAVGDSTRLAQLLEARASTPLTFEQRLGLRRAAEERFAFPKMVEGYENVYDEILGKDRRPS
jgi:glycosyltransferase involved in cell wall biosynthesis